MVEVRIGTTASRVGMRQCLFPRLYLQQGCSLLAAHLSRFYSFLSFCLKDSLFACLASVFAC